MIDFFKKCVLSQFEAALWMLHDCIEKCPADYWSGPKSFIAKYEFWHVVHHVLSCTDEYLAENESAIKPRPEFHPAGMSDLENEYPSREFSKAEMQRYVRVCLAMLREALAAETEESLRAHCGFSWRDNNRGEIYLYSMRHVMHHVGQLSAKLRKAGQDPKWKGSWWDERK